MSIDSSTLVSVIGDVQHGTKIKKGTKEVPVTESPGSFRKSDIDVWDGLESLIEQNGHSYKHVLELWPAYVRRIHMARYLAHYELFKQVIDLPGCIVELGVYRGPSFFTWSKLMETFCPGDRSRKVFGFDSFKGLGGLDPKDGKEFPQAGKVTGGWSAEAVRDEVHELVRLSNMDNFIKHGSPRVSLIEGDIEETLPQFLEENPGLRISLLHLDMDLYKPTKKALELLFPLVVKGGLVVFDEYGLIPWAGESNAADEYFREIGIEPEMKSFPFSAQPQGYFVK